MYDELIQKEKSNIKRFILDKMSSEDILDLLCTTKDWKNDDEILSLLFGYISNDVNLDLTDIVYNIERLFSAILRYICLNCENPKNEQEIYNSKDEIINFSGYIEIEDLFSDNKTALFFKDKFSIYSIFDKVVENWFESYNETSVEYKAIKIYYIETHKQNESKILDYCNIMNTIEKILKELDQ